MAWGEGGQGEGFNKKKKNRKHEVFSCMGVIKI